MMGIAPALAAAALYLFCTFWHGRTMARADDAASRPGSVRMDAVCAVAASLALAAHGGHVWQLAHGQDDWRLGLFVALPLAAWAVAALAFLDSWWRPVSCLLIAVFPIAAAVVFSSSFGAYSGAPLRGLGAGMIAHIALSVLAYGMVAIAALQALALAARNYELKRRAGAPLRWLPPLQTLERMLFQTLWAGFALLVAAIVSGALSLGDAPERGFAHKTTFSLLSAGLLAALLWGHHRLGWRGFTAVRWTLAGFACLALAWLGVEFVLEALLDAA